MEAEREMAGLQVELVVREEKWAKEKGMEWMDKHPRHQQEKVVPGRRAGGGQRVIWGRGG